MHHRIFVYGTLRHSQANHHLLEGGQYLGPHRTPPRYTMLEVGGYPGVISGGRASIVGEIYRVDEQTLRNLDRLEDHPRLYTRELIPSPYGRAWMYLFRGATRDRSAIPSGDWCRPTRSGL